MPRSGRRKAKGAVSAPKSRYTPPAARIGPAPRWIPVLTLALIVGGPAVIVLNYLGVLPASPTNWYLLVGIGIIGLGVLVGTQYR